MKVLIGTGQDPVNSDGDVGEEASETGGTELLNLENYFAKRRTFLTLSAQTVPACCGSGLSFYI